MLPGSFHDPLARRSAASRHGAIGANNPVDTPVTGAPGPTAGLVSQAQSGALPVARQAPGVAVGVSPRSQLQPAVGPLQPEGRLTEEFLEGIDPDETESE
jgi:hypothetical protein